MLSNITSNLNEKQSSQREANVTISDHKIKKASGLSSLQVNFIETHSDPLLRSVLTLEEQLPDVYIQILQDFFFHFQNHSHVNPKRVVNTVLACAKIESQSDQIAGLENEIERIKFISRQCGINAEPDFCPGSNFRAVKSILDNRLETLRCAYTSSKSRNLQQQFFEEAFLGDPCLNGKFIALSNFAVKIELQLDLQNEPDRFSYDEIAFKFTELMYGLSDETPPEQEKFVEYLKSQKSYDLAYKIWVESTQFNAIYRRAVEFFT